MTTQDDINRAKSLVRLCSAVIDCVEEIGDNDGIGAPGGHLYASLMSVLGCSYEQFEQIMTLCVASGRVAKRGHCYFPTEK
jgi:hypothetical protein